MHKSLSVTWLYLFLGLIAVSSVSARGLFGFGSAEKGSGELSTVTRNVETFDAIKSSGSFEIHVTVGGEQKVEVTFDDNLLEFVETEVHGGTLKLRTTENVSSKHRCSIEIVVRELEEVRCSGSGWVEVVGLDSDHFEFDLSGSGRLTLDGKAEEMEITVSGSGDVEAEGSAGELNVHVSGSGDVDASGLVARDAYVRVSGSGKVSVHAEEEFDADVSGSGNITYYGNPEHVSTSVSGSGRIRKR